LGNTVAAMKCMHAYIHTDRQTDRQTYIHVCVCVCTRTYIYTYTYTYIHVYIYTCIHVYKYVHIHLYMYTHWAHMKGNLSQRRSLLHTDHYYTQIITTHRSLLHTDHYYTHWAHMKGNLSQRRSLLRMYTYIHICTRTFVPTNVHIHSYIRKPEPTQIVTVHIYIYVHVHSYLQTYIYIHTYGNLSQRRLLLCTPHAPTNLKMKPSANDEISSSSGGGDMREFLELDVRFCTSAYARSICMLPRAGK